MEKQFVGSAKIINTKYGELTKISFSKTDLETLTKALNNGWVNCVVKEKKNKVEGKPTHYLEIDNYKSDKAPQTTDQAEQAYGKNDKDLPF